MSAKHHPGVARLDRVRLWLDVLRAMEESGIWDTADPSGWHQRLARLCNDGLRLTAEDAIGLERLGLTPAVVGFNSEKGEVMPMK